MLQFICPHCDEVLNVSRESLGLAGKCNICGKRIALIGDPNAPGPQTASVATDDLDSAPPMPSGPATPKQKEYLSGLGAVEEALEDIDRECAGDFIRILKARRRETAPPSARQIAYLQKLGAKPHQIENLRTMPQASNLIEVLQPAPAKKQIKYLKKLGATDEEIEELTSQGEASFLIQELEYQKKKKEEEEEEEE